MFKITLILFLFLIILFITIRIMRSDENRPLLSKILEQHRVNKQNTQSLESGGTGSTQSCSYIAGGNIRTYLLYTPPSNLINAPLIIVLHGTMGTGAKMQFGLGFDIHADKKGFFVAYPDALADPNPRPLHKTLRWNDGRNTLPSSARKVDDVDAIGKLIDDIAKHVSIDRSRVFVTGASNGGIMTYRLGCEASELFAGIAPVIGNIAEPLYDTCSPRTPLSVLSINGSDDPFIPLNGGTVCEGIRKSICEGGRVVSREKSLSKFLKYASCNKDPIRSILPRIIEDGTEVEKLAYQCSDNVQIVSYIVHGMGHVWPPNSPQATEKLSGNNSHNLDATAEIVDFFLNIPRKS